MSVRVTTFNSLDEAFTKLSTGRLKFDVIFTAPDHLSRLVGRKLVQPLNLDLVPNLQDRGLAGAAEPVLRRRPALQRPVHALHDRDRLAQRQARELRPGRARRGTSFWKSEPFRGQVGVLDDSREALGMALMRRGVTEPQHRGPGAARARRPTDLKELNQIARVKVTITGYETLPAGRMWLQPGRGRATCSTRSSPTCPRARSATCSRTGTSRPAGRSSTTASASAPRPRSR